MSRPVTAGCGVRTPTTRMLRANERTSNAVSRRFSPSPANAPSAFSAAAEKAEGAFAGDGLNRRDTAFEVRSFARNIRVVGVRTPQPAVTGRLMPVIDDRFGQTRQAVDRTPAHEECHAALVMFEGVKETPEAGAHAVGEHFFLTEIAPPRGHHAQYLAEPFVRCVAIADGEFGTLFEINDKGHCDAGAVRPDDRWPPVAVAEQVGRPAQKALSSTL